MSQKMTPFLLRWITVKNSLFNDFWYMKSWENFTQQLIDLPTSPVGCSHLYFKKSKKSLFNYIITGSIVLRASRWYFIHSEADFEVSRPAGATCCTDGGEIWHGGGDLCPLLRAKFHPHRWNNKGAVPQKLKFLLRFDQNVEYKGPAGAHRLRDFHKICRVCTPFQDALNLLKFGWICSRGYGGFKLSWLPSNFQYPLAAKLCVRARKVFEVQERAWGPLSPCQFGGARISPDAGTAKNVRFFVCLFVALLDVRVRAPDFAMKALAYRNDFDAVG